MLYSRSTSISLLFFFSPLTLINHLVFVWLSSLICYTPTLSRMAMSSTSIVEVPMFKNKLQEYTQKRGLAFPAYRTDNEGSQHAPKFRSTVFVNGVEYTSKFTFRRLKSAQQDAAKLAYECIMSNARHIDAKPLQSEVSQDKLSNKFLLYEYAHEQHLDTPTYKTYTSNGEGQLPLFISTVTVAGRSFTGDGGKSKEEAEQLAAHAAFNSLRGADHSAAVLSQMVSLKRKRYEAIKRVKFTGSIAKNPRNTSVNGSGSVSEMKGGNTLIRANARSSTAPTQLRSGFKQGR